MTHQVGPKQRKGNDKERIQTKYPFAKPVIRHQRRGLQWRKRGLPASALMFKKPWRTSVTMNNSQRRRAPLPLYLQTRRVLILHVTRVLMYTSTVTAKEFIDIDIRGFLAKFKPKVKTVAEKLSFKLRIWPGHLVIDILKSSQVVIFSHSTIFITFSYRSLAGFLFKLLRSSRPLKPEVALDFCVWPLCASGVYPYL